MSKALANFLQSYQLPVDISDADGENFADFFYTYLQQYAKGVAGVSQSPVITQSSSNVGVLASQESKAINEISEFVGRILYKYLEGNPVASYCIFEEMIDSASLAKELLMLDVIKINKKTFFFRAQKNYNAIEPVLGSHSWSKTASPTDLFHTPFNKRKRVGTNRFSVPGYPCLYLSSELHASFREITQDAIIPLDCICLENNRPLYIADISPISKEIIQLCRDGKADFDVSNDLIKYAKIFPIIAACHTKIKYEYAYENEVKFKMEYIIPQLMLQWFQRYSTYPIDGIKYLSCTSSNLIGEPLYNFIFITHYSKGKIFCPKLSALFNASDVLTIGKPDGTKSIDAWLKEIEILLHSSHKKNLHELISNGHIAV